MSSSDNADQIAADIRALLTAGGGPDVFDRAMANCCREEREREQRLIKARVNAGPMIEIPVETYEKLKRAARLAELGSLPSTENRHPRLIRLR